LLSLAVDLVHPVGAEVCTNNIAVPDGNAEAVGAAHVPSPRQNVLEEALVPLPKLVTGKLPVTWVAKLTLESVPPRVNLIDKNVGSHDELDSDFIFDCKGFPKEFSEHHKSEYISVNAVYVTQCFWDFPKFDYTLTIAMPHGWVFGIPLNNRCAIGYMYNDQISTLDEVKEDVKNVFDRFGLNPSEKTLELHFNNYYRKQNFTKRAAYSGNTSFFLEPLEATSIGFMDNIQRMTYGYLFNGNSLDLVNSSYTQFIQEIENIIMLHYFAGSKHKTPFWEYAQDRGQKCMEKAVKNPRFKEFYKDSKEYDFKNYLNTPIEKMMYGSWDKRIMNMNLQSLDLIDKIDKLIGV